MKRPPRTDHRNTTEVTRMEISSTLTSVVTSVWMDGLRLARVWTKRARPMGCFANDDYYLEHDTGINFMTHSLALSSPLHQGEREKEGGGGTAATSTDTKEVK